MNSNNVSLRNYIAAEALQGLLANPAIVDELHIYSEIIETAWRYADEMIKWRDFRIELIH